MFELSDAGALDQRLVTAPSERLDVEYKSWLNLRDAAGKADLAQALIALANHGGGRVVLGFAADEDGVLQSQMPGNRPPRTQYSSDAVNGVVDAYADPTFNVEVDFLRAPATGVEHPILFVPGDTPVPVMAKKGGPNNEHLRAHTVYVRRPGPQSAPPRTPADWERLFARLVRVRMDAIERSNRADGASITGIPPDEGIEANPQSIRSRMSDDPPPVGGRAGIDEAARELDEDDRLILRSDLDDAKVEAFRRDIGDALDSMPLAKLFSAVGTLKVQQDFDSRLLYGHDTLLFKGPFVEGSRWVHGTYHSFAWALEEFRLNRFIELIDARLSGSEPTLDTAESLRTFVQTARSEIEADGGVADIILLTGRASDAFTHDLYRMFDWSELPRIRSVDLSETELIMHPIAGLPVLWFRGSDFGNTAHVISLPDYEDLRLRPLETASNDLHVSVDIIDEEEAMKVVGTDRLWRKSLSPEEGQELSVDEAVVRLQLRVKVLIRAAGTVKERHRPHTRSAIISSDI